MMSRFFTNHAEQTLLRKFKGVFEHNPDIEWFDALVVLSRHLVQVASLHRYAEFRGAKLAFLEEINQRHLTRESGAS